MQLKHNYWFFSKALSKENCDKIISTGNARAKEKGKIFGLTPKTRGQISSAIRDCIIAWLEDPWIYDLINPFVATANTNAGWNFQYDWNESCQFTEYSKNHFYGWHNDQMQHGSNKAKNLQGKMRKLTLSLQLTDPSEYEGGDFQFKWIGDDGLKVETPKSRELGTIIIFPSFLWHQVTPVTKGVRKALVNWTIGKPFV